MTFSNTPEQDERAASMMTAHLADGIFRLADEIEVLARGDREDTVEPREYADRMVAIIRLAGGSLVDQRGYADLISPTFANTAALWRAFLERVPERCLAEIEHGPFTKEGCPHHV